MSESSAAAEATAEVLLPQEELLGHPKGLSVLVGTEFWDRISFHGMQALLVLYMAEHLLLPGHVEQVVGFAGFRGVIESVTGPLSIQALAFQIFGIYLGIIYLTPLLGGLLGDRVLGRNRTVALGALLMTTGHFFMAFEASFLGALLLITFGAGCLRGNLMAQLGAVYSPTDRRRADAFQIYAASINAGAFVAPLISGALAKGFGWHYGFGFAGFGMLIGLAVYLWGVRHLPAQALNTGSRQRVPLTPPERRVVLVLMLLLPVLGAFWVAQTQVWNVYNVWVRDYVNLTVAGWTMPVPWLQSIDGLAPLACMPLVVAWWRRQAKRGREPDEPRKLALGALFFSLSTIWLAVGNVVIEPGGKIPLLWPLVFHLTSNLGWLYFVPTAMALFVRKAPPSVTSQMTGVYYLCIFLGSLVSGRLGVLYERLTPSQFWLLHSAIVGGGAVVLVVFGRQLRRELQGSPSPAPP